MDDRGVSPRLATPADVVAIVSTLSAAFDADPLWSWAFPDDERRPAQYEAFFGLFVEERDPKRLGLDNRPGHRRGRLDATWPERAQR